MRMLTRHSRWPNLAGRLGLLVALLMATLLGGCAPRWTIALEVDGTPATPLTGKAWKESWGNFPGEAADGQAMPLERLLSEAGVDSAETLEMDGRSWRWEEICADAWVGRDGRVTVGADTAEAPTMLSVRRPPEAGRARSTHLDLAPTIAAVLGLPAPQQATGSALTDLRADRAVLIILDGLGFRWYEASRGQGVTPFLDGLDAPTLARSVYPPVTRVSMAAILSGALPSVNGVRDRGTRNLAVQSILQAVTEAGRRAVVVEGRPCRSTCRAPSCASPATATGTAIPTTTLMATLWPSSPKDCPSFCWSTFTASTTPGTPTDRTRPSTASA